ncbi:MAG: DegT/DnrJ/EryC1/StrS family aminotransferase [Saprospiraceae bacterium]|nr:DegT/DnrJ/EryC1/StrS family aminotransferase [Saprospiraceae bacterium]
MPATIPIQMVDLSRQYLKIKDEIDQAISNVLASTRYIQGPIVEAFESELADYLNVKHVISCGNGTDALQIAVMACGLQPGDEVIVPAFTYVATAEVIGLLQLRPVMIDVDPESFNISAASIEAAITTRTKAIVPVHLFGQSAPMEEIMEVANKYKLWVIEDNAQAIGADFTFANGKTHKAGTIGHIGCTSFFPSKNLGCYGDGGAIFTNDDDLAVKLKMVANHGQSRRYYHDILGVNSRLDAIQAAILRVKLQYLDVYCQARQAAADQYDNKLKTRDEIFIPRRVEFSTHVFHQYTLQVPPADRDQIRTYLSSKSIPSMIYYPVPLYKQKAYAPYWTEDGTLPVAEKLCQSVLSLPIHTEMDEALTTQIANEVLNYFKK